VTISSDSDDNGAGSDGDDRSIIQTINLSGAGGSFQTGQRIACAITSSDPLGDLILQSWHGIEANITAPSIFGDIAATNGGISGIIQTTAGNIGRVLSGWNCHFGGATFIQAASGLTGTILSSGDLISQIYVRGGFQGTIAAGGSLGYLQSTSWGGFHRYGGMNVSGGFSGNAVFLGNIYGDISISGGLNGRIAAQGMAIQGLDPARNGILGNINISGGAGSSAAIVSGGEIGDAGVGTCTDFDETDLDVCCGYEGILAAVGPISYEITGCPQQATIFNDVGNPNSPQYAGGVNQAAIDAIFIGSTPGALTIGELPTLLANLNNLHVGSDGNLSDSSSG
jgi:hypothetical protein